MLCLKLRWAPMMRLYERPHWILRPNLPTHIMTTKRCTVIQLPRPPCKKILKERIRMCLFPYEEEFNSYVKSFLKEETGSRDLQRSIGVRNCISSAIKSATKWSDFSSYIIFPFAQEYLVSETRQRNCNEIFLIS